MPTVGAALDFPRMTLTEQFDRLIARFADLSPQGYWLSEAFQVKALLTVLLVCLICGAVGSLVVGNRMAFFSDALAHCAFAGVTLGMLLALTTGSVETGYWLAPTVMVIFGIVIGLAIAFVRENTNLASDTVIGVFFAFAVGFGGMMLGTLSRSTYINPETFMFGSVLFVFTSDILVLAALAALLGGVLLLGYNQIVAASFSASLAKSRGVRVRFWNYAFIILLALIVNLCLRTVGALLINALLVVPAATAANLGRGMRRMFWWSVGVSTGCGIVGLWLSHAVEIPVRNDRPISLSPSGTVVVLSVAAFVVSVVWRVSLDRPRAAREAT